MAVYQGIPKHKHPWEQGRRGTLCPPDADGPALFSDSIPDPDNARRVYATDGHCAYCAMPSNVVTDDGHDVWHGFPVTWQRVPWKVQRAWVSQGLIARPRRR